MANNEIVDIDTVKYCFSKHKKHCHTQISDTDVGFNFCMSQYTHETKQKNKKENNKKKQQKHNTT